MEFCAASGVEFIKDVPRDPRIDGDGVIDGDGDIEGVESCKDMFAHARDNFGKHNKMITFAKATTNMIIPNL